MQAGEISRDRFARLIPERPYCTDNPTFGVYVRPKNAAVRRAYIQPNSPWRHPFIAFDIDREGAALAAENAGMPCPTFTVVNPGTAHTRISFMNLNFPCTWDTARKPIGFSMRFEAVLVACSMPIATTAGCLSKIRYT